MIPAILPPDGLQLPGATPVQIALCEREAGVVLPRDHAAFLMRSNGYNGPVGLGYLQLWDTSALVAAILGYYLADDMAGVFYIGSNAGPTAYGVDRGGGDPVYVSVPFVPAERCEVRVLGNSFAEFVAAIAAGEGW